MPVSARTTRWYNRAKGYIEREAVNVGYSAAGYPPFGWFKRKRAVWSNAYDDLLVPVPKRPKIQDSKETTKEKMRYRRSYGRRYMRRPYRRRYARRYKRRYARRRRWGRRVRKAALRSVESKRWVIEWERTLNEFTNTSNALWVFPLCHVPHSSGGATGSALKNYRVGTSINATGLKIHGHLNNLKSGYDVCVRVIVYNKKYDRANAEAMSRIFMYRESEEAATLPDILGGSATPATYFNASVAPKCKRVGTYYYDRTFHLKDTAAQETFAESAKFSIWIPFRGRPMKFEAGSIEGDLLQNFSPQMMVFAWNRKAVPMGNEPEAAIADLRFFSTFYFKDP